MFLILETYFDFKLNDTAVVEIENSLKKKKLPSVNSILRGKG